LLEHFIFVDYDGLKGPESITTVTGETETDYDLEFTTKIIERDGICIASGTMAFFCDATHLIPRIKGNEVTFVVHLCASLMTLLIVHLAGH